MKGAKPWLEKKGLETCNAKKADAGRYVSALTDGG
jgi:hypothetical protein